MLVNSLRTPLKAPWTASHRARPACARLPTRPPHEHLMMTVPAPTFTRLAVAALALMLSGCGKAPDSSFPGYIEGEVLYLAAPLAGYLDTLPVTRGSRVAQGAPVFAVAAEPEQQGLREAAGARNLGTRESGQPERAAPPERGGGDGGPVACRRSRPAAVRTAVAAAGSAAGQGVRLRRQRGCRARRQGARPGPGRCRPRATRHVPHHAGPPARGARGPGRCGRRRGAGRAKTLAGGQESRDGAGRRRNHRNLLPPR